MFGAFAAAASHKKARGTSNIAKWAKRELAARKSVIFVLIEDRQ
jgi:hypothetical protein